MPGKMPTIICVALNPCWDRTLEVAGLEVGKHLRGRLLSVQAAGKAVNVARLLAALGTPSVLTGFVGAGDRRGPGPPHEETAHPGRQGRLRPLHRQPDAGAGRRDVRRPAAGLLREGSPRGRRFQRPGAGGRPSGQGPLARQTEPGGTGRGRRRRRRHRRRHPRRRRDPSPAHRRGRRHPGRRGRDALRPGGRLAGQATPGPRRRHQHRGLRRRTPGRLRPLPRARPRWPAARRRRCNCGPARSTPTTSTPPWSTSRSNRWRDPPRREPPCREPPRREPRPLVAASLRRR